MDGYQETHRLYRLRHRRVTHDNEPIEQGTSGNYVRPSEHTQHT